MPSLLQINPVLRQSTSTGRIMREIGEVAMAAGWESYVAYSKGRDGLMSSTSNTVPVGSKWDVALHGLTTRLLDRHGLGSAGATRRFISEIERLNPDIVHIHNIHGYFLNYPLLFKYLRESGRKVVWTVHDCWLYTGHCYYYSSTGCDRWQRGCGNCPQRGEFPRSWLIDHSARNFTMKRDAFTSLDAGNFVLVTVSEWMKDEMQHSFFKDCRFKVIHNGIDLDVFSPSADTDATRAKYKLSEPKIYLGVASIWMDEKGLSDLIKIAGQLDTDERIVIIGKLPNGTENSLPNNITHISRTDNAAELARLYSTASAFLNPTWQDNYPTVNMESLACGTPVVTYRTGGSPESLSTNTGCIVEQGDTDGMLAVARRFASADREQIRKLCRAYAESRHSKLDRYKDYLSLYEELMSDKF